jgi:N-acetylmuramoyl-L-alanine amidase
MNKLKRVIFLRPVFQQPIRVLQRRYLWVALLVMNVMALNATAAEITNISLVQTPQQSSLHFTVSGGFTHKLLVLKNPDRVVLDLSNVGLHVQLSQLGITSPLIREIRANPLNANTLRLVFGVGQAVDARTSPWIEQGKLKGFALHFIKKGASTAQAQQPVTTAKKLSVQKKQNTAVIRKEAPLTQPIIAHQKPTRVLNQPQKLRDVIVVIDAGHGGKDPGAHGPRNSREKYVVLAIALKLKQYIDRQPGMRAVLTRSGDYYVGLRQRLDIARKYNGDIFVSIHADAFSNPHSNGASVFALSASGATSEAARWIAEKENYSELGGVNLGNLDDTNGIVRSVLIDLSQTATINASLQMGSGVLGNLRSLTRLHSNKVEQARFMVLKSPDIPSILIETGFISNPIEERNLTSQAYQDRLSRSIFAGLKAYFWNNPPHGTRIEAMTSNGALYARNG